MILLIFTSFQGYAFFGNDYISYREVKEKIKTMVSKGNTKEASSYFSKQVSSGSEWCVRFYKNGKCRNLQKALSNKQLDVISKDIFCGEAYSNCNSNKYMRNNLSTCIKKLKNNCPITSAWDKGHPTKETSLLSKIVKLKKSGGFSKNKYMNAAINKCKANLLWSFKRRIEDGEKRYFKPVSKIKYELVKQKKYKESYFGRFKSEKECHVERLKEKRAGLKVNSTCKKVYIGNAIKSNFYNLPIMYKSKSRLHKGTVRDTFAKFKSLATCNKAISKGFTYKTPNSGKVKIYPKNSVKINSIQGVCSKRNFIVCETGDTSPKSFN